MNNHYEYLIIGAGPAGLQMAYCMEQSGHSYLILERGSSAGTFFKKFPRHRKLISINKVYTGHDDAELNLRWDWNSLLSGDEKMLYKQYSKRFFPAADTMIDYLKGFAEHFQLKIKYDVEVSNISKKDQQFRVEDRDGNVYTCLRLIIATGLNRPFVPPIPGIELAENYTEVSVDPDEFTGQRVLIIGKGNSGFETADNITETTATIHLASPHPLRLAWKSHHVGHLRAVNNNLLDTYLLKAQNGLLDAKINSIERTNGKLTVSFSYQRAHGATVEYQYDRIIVCAGFRFDDSIFDESCRPALVIDERFPDQTSEWESTTVKDLFFAGNLMQMRDFKKTASAFIHGFRYNVRALYHILERKYHGKEWPSRSIAATPEAVLDAVLDRLNRSSALWQQTGFICDLVVVSTEDGEARYYEELPVDYVRESDFGQQQHYYLVTLEYGPDYPDYPFDFVRFIGPDEGHLNPQLHPIIRRFNGSTLVAEHHIQEDLEGRWLTDNYILPLRAFFQKQLA
ncbi:MAG TPA: NAD(P)-binding domain-containing protein [Pyrinomonadaceae bacterium]|jgi:thioredoxin reductase